MKKQKRDQWIQIRCTVAEKARIKFLANKFGWNLSAWIIYQSIEGERIYYEAYLKKKKPEKKQGSSRVS